MEDRSGLTARDHDSLRQSYITPEGARDGQLFRVDSIEGAELVGRNGSGNYAGIVFPNILPGETRPREYRLRRDHPDLERRSDGTTKAKAKYLSPPGRGNLFYFPPGTPSDSLRDTTIRTVFTEGEKKALALRRFFIERGEQVLVIALPGVWNWRGTVGKAVVGTGARRDVKGPIPDFDLVTWRGRGVDIVFDANVATDDSVRAARRGLKKELAGRGAIIRLIDVPQMEGVNGVDDLLALKGPEFVQSLFDRADAKSEGTDGRGSQATRLVTLAGAVELFHTPEGEPYGSVEVDGHLETWPLRSRGFREWWTRRFYESDGSVPNSQAYQDALGVLSGHARFRGERREIYVRVAFFEGAAYVDLADDDWRVVEITAEGWQVIPASSAPVRFRRPVGSLPLPEPRPGKLDALRPFVNVTTQGDWSLLLGWLVACLRPGQPVPLLALYGAQGSAKSTLSRMLVSLIDPSKAALRCRPRDERDLMIAARNRWCLSFDNLSHISDSFSDALCRLATGGGLSTRELYTDAEEVLFEALRPIIINGIEELATNGDLIDRAVILCLPSLSPAARRRESDLWREFEGARPFICGALYSAVSTALRRVDGVSLKELPRMADFAAWAAAAEPAFGVPEGTFIKAYTVNRAAASVTALGESPVSDAVMKFLDSLPEPRWTGTATDLLSELKKRVPEHTLREKGWPKAPNALTNKLRRLEPSLRAVGVEFRDGRTTGRERSRLLTLERVGEGPSASSAQTVGVEGQPFTADGSDGTDDPAKKTSSAPNPRQTQADTAPTDDADDGLRDFSDAAEPEESDATIAEVETSFGDRAADEAERRVWEGYDVNS